MEGHRLLPPPRVSAVLKCLRAGIERKKEILLPTARGSEVARSKGPPERSGKRMESVALSTHRANTVLGVLYNWLLLRHHCEVVIITPLHR